jgi:hypothetical protein
MPIQFVQQYRQAISNRQTTLHKHFGTHLQQWE